MASARRVAVIGGGWAGLAAAVEARSRGWDVTLFEMARHWGGRARRVDADGLALDNGQHIMIGAYVETLRLMRQVGVDIDAAFLRMPLRLCTPDGRGLSLPPGPPVWAFLRGVWGHTAWSPAERGALLATAGAWAARGFRCDEATTVQQLTARLPMRVQAELIEPLCVAALNTPMRAASGRVFLRVLRDALFSGRGSADLLLPRWRLSELFPSPAVRWLEENAVHLQLATRVNSVAREAGRWSVDGEPYDRVILTTTALEAARLASGVDPAWARCAETLSYEPIVTVYARSAGARLPEPLFALPSDEHEKPAQFVFDLGQLGGEPGTLAFVISGARPWIDRGLAITEELTRSQGASALSMHLRAPLEVLRTLTEKRATFRCTPGLARPSAHIAPGLHAAGDYVAGPYPATLEGAVRAAVQAVRSLD